MSENKSIKYKKWFWGQNSKQANMLSKFFGVVGFLGLFLGIFLPIYIYFSYGNFYIGYELIFVITISVLSLLIYNNGKKISQHLKVEELQHAKNFKFVLKEGYIKKSSLTSEEPSKIALPSGVCEILINTFGKPVKKNRPCYFTNINTNCVFIDVGFPGVHVCGDLLITIKEMGYDLASKDNWKSAEGKKEKILAEYEKLVLEKPELFDSSRINLDELERSYEENELIKKYGEEDGIMIFTGKISEKNYLKKKALIKKYGEKDGMLIFNKKISEKNYLKKKENEKRKKELIGKYGKKFGEAVFNKKLLNGMSKAMVSESIGKPNYKDSEKWYYGEPFNKYILFEKNKVIQQSTLSEGIWLDMPKNMLIVSYGKPEDEKKEVSKKGIKLKWYYGGRETRQRTTAYSLEVRLENDLVVGWKELE